MYSDTYTQSTKTSCDTLSDTRCEFYIPPKATFTKHWFVTSDVKLINGAGTEISAEPTVAASQTLDSAPSCVERYSMMHGNGAGEILEEVTNHAHALFKMRMQGRFDASEFGYFINDKDDFGSNLGASTTTDANDKTIALIANSDIGIPVEYLSQLNKLQTERQQKYRYFGRMADDINARTGKVVFMSSDLIPKKMPHFPHLLTSRGVTHRFDLRSDAFHLIPKRAITSEEYKDNIAGGAITDARVRFSNMQMTTLEVVPSIEFQKALLDYQMSKGYFAYPCYSVQG